jgi:hypothetical protein
LIEATAKRHAEPSPAAAKPLDEAYTAAALGGRRRASPTTPTSARSTPTR